MAALLWFGAAALLAAAELLGSEFFLLMLAGGALAASGTAAVAPDNVWLPFVVFAVVSLLLMLLVRPVLVRRMAVTGPADVLLERVIGAPAFTTTEVSERHGQAKVGGEVWTARVPDGHPPIPAGVEVRVREVRGATLYIESE